MTAEVKVHSTAFVHPGAELGAGVVVGEYCVIGPKVRIGEGTSVGPHTVIVGRTTIGAANRIYNHASLGQDPQDLKFKGEDSELVIGDRNQIREFVTVNKGTAFGGGRTVIGSECLLMACCHVAHDCWLGDGVILGNNVLLGGHCRIEEFSILNGSAAVNPFTTIGAYAYIGGLTRIVQDAPPFMITEGHPARTRGVNVVGLQRKGFSAECVREIREAYKRIFNAEGTRSEAMGQALREKRAFPEVIRLVEFLQRSEQGKKGRYLESLRGEKGEGS